MLYHTSSPLTMFQVIVDTIIVYIEVVAHTLRSYDSNGHPTSFFFGPQTYGKFSLYSNPLDVHSLQKKSCLARRAFHARKKPT